jgi:hypothetical protein
MASTGGGFLSGLTKNPAEALAVGGLGLDLIRGNQTPAFEGNLSSIAKNDAATGARLENYMNTGTLPPGMQSSLNTAANDAAAAIRSEYAQRGMSGSSAEAQDLASLTQRIQAQGEQLATQLFSSGVSETNAADSIYAQLMNVQLQQDNALSSSIGNLVSAFARMGTPVAAGGSVNG